jgi:hypothetical protein
MNTQTDLFPLQSPAEAKTDRAPELGVAPGWASGELAKLPVLSIRQPWAWMIVHGGKDIENRNWPTKFRGRFLIHAGKGCTRQEYEDAEGFAWCNDVAPPPLADLKRGGIVGVAEIVDCVSDSDSDWFVGEYGFVLRNAQPLDFLPCAGALGFFRLPNTKLSGAAPESRPLDASSPLAP